MLNLFSQRYQYAPVAQLDRVRGYEPRGREFESLRARHNYLLILAPCICDFLGFFVI